jgi:hypothetical protein
MTAIRKLTTPRAARESVARCRPVGFMSTPARRRDRALRESVWTCGIPFGRFSPTDLTEYSTRS